MTDAKQGEMTEAEQKNNARDPAVTQSLATSLQEALRRVDRYLVLAIGVSAFILLHEIGMRMGTTQAEVNVPHLPVSTTPGVAVLLGFVVYVVVGVLAAFSLNHAKFLIRELESEKEFLTATLSLPSSSATGGGWLIAAVPPILLFVAYLLEPAGRDSSGFEGAMGFVFLALPYIYVLTGLHGGLDPANRAEPGACSRALSKYFARRMKKDSQSREVQEATSSAKMIIAFVLLIAMPIVLIALLKHTPDPPEIIDVDRADLVRELDENVIAALLRYDSKRVRIRGRVGRFEGTLASPTIYLEDDGLRCNVKSADAKGVAELRPGSSVVVTGMLRNQDGVALDQCVVEKSPK